MSYSSQKETHAHPSTFASNMFSTTVLVLLIKNGRVTSGVAKILDVENEKSRRGQAEFVGG